MFPWDPSQMSRRRSAYSTESSTATAYLVTVYFTTIYSRAEKIDRMHVDGPQISLMNPYNNSF